MKTYSSKSNAIRAFRSANPDNTMSNDELRDRIVEADGGYAVVIADRAVGEDGLPVIKGTGAYKDVPLLRRSDEGGAVSAAWGVFDEMPAGSSRKDCIAEAVDQGIAFYTARTQYQKWLHRNDPKPE